MKFLMAFVFFAIPALIVAVPLWFVVGPFAVLVGLAIFGFGVDVCFNSAEQKR